MIDEQLIESAKIIRKSFLKLSGDMSEYRKELEKLVEFLNEKVEVLKKIQSDTIRDKQGIYEVSTKILQEINEIEVKEKKLHKKVSDINTKIERLRNDEENLYTTIRSRYSELSEEDIIAEIQKNLEK